MKQLLKKHWPLFSIGLLLIVIGFYLFGAREEIVENPLLTDATPGEGIKLKDIHYTQDNPDEKIKWTLDAQEVEYSQDGQFITFRDFVLKLEPVKKPSIEVKGRIGDYNKNSGEINLRGDVKGYADNGYRIFTDHILYNLKKGFLRTEEPVRILGPSFSISGNALYFDIENEILRIISGVTASIHQRFVIS